VPVCQVYGATETGPVSVVLKPHQSLANAGMAGWPALGVQVRVVAADGSTAQSGELWIQAANLMRGYHREPDDTAFAGGWFRTGDIGRQRADGCIEVVGRLKDMIVSGGENIYPAEIENLALEDPAVAEAAVVGVADERWGEVPVLALVLRDAGVDYAEIEQRLRVVFADRLARYKHPRRVVVVASLPKTALGKIKKAELAAKFDA
jgi:fatty-acyl-CoA synthase